MNNCARTLLAGLSICMLLGTQVQAQVSLPEALQGNPLEDRMIGNEPVSPMRPIHFFPLDGSIVDQVTGVTGTMTGGVSHSAGYIDAAIHFDGSGYVQIPVDLDIGAIPDLTLIAMVKPDPLPEDPDDRAQVYNTGYVFGDGEGLVYMGNQTKEVPRFDARSNRAIVTSSNNPAMRDAWQMVALTRKIETRTLDDGTPADHVVLRLFTNGRMSEAVAPYIPKMISPGLFLATVSAGSSSMFRGSIDHLSIYDRALTEDELREMLSAFRHASNPQRDTLVADRNVVGSAETIEPGGEPGQVEAGGEQQFPGDMFDEDEEQFPGDMFEGDEQQFPGDMFESDEQQFPGDMFEGEQPPGPGATPSSEPPDRFGQPPSAEQLAGRIDEANEATERRSAAAQTGIDNSPILSGNGIGTGGTEFSQEEAAINETEEFLASDETQRMLQSADWRIEGVVPNSIDETHLYPGGEVTLKVRVVKNDPANAIPDVILNIDGTQDLPFRVMTSQQVPMQTRDIPVTLVVPRDIAFSGNANEANYTFEARILAADGSTLVDANPRNHSRLFGVVISKPAEEELQGEPQITPPVPLSDWSGNTSACQSIGEFMADAWEYMDDVLPVVCTAAITAVEPSTAEDGGLAKTYRQCTSTTKKIKRGTEKAVSLFNDLADNSWATLGPRVLKLNQGNSGVLVYPGDRKFVSAVPVRTETVELNVAELSGKAQTEVIVCTRSENGTIQRLDKNIVFNFNKTSSNKFQNETFLLGDVQDKFISVLLQTDFNENISITNIAPRFQYRLRVDEQEAED